MATLAQLEAALVKADAAGNEDDARAFAAEIRKMRSAPAEPSASIGQQVKQQAGNLVAGAVRGAGSIGATLLAPIDIAKDAMDGKGLSLESNRQRRADMDAALGTLGADTESLAFKGGKLTGEIAGTAGAGGALANALTRMAPRAAAAAPNALAALQTSGMSAGNATGAAGVGVRALGGATAGAASAGLVNPEDAGTGALIGGALPGVVQLAGGAGNALGRLVRGPAQDADLQAAVAAARDAGYVIPPTQAKPTLGNRLMEGLSGKITTAQNASAKNQGVTAKLIAEDLGLPAETKITTEVLDGVRKEAGKAYAAVASLPARPAVAADTMTNTPAMPAMDPKAMVFDLRKARNDATAWFRSYGRTADPDALAKAQAASATAKQLESSLEDYAASMGRDDLVPALREARQLIAKTYSVEGALNPTTGGVDARKLAAQLNKGKPLSGGMKEAAEFANRFPKAAQTVEGMGSLPQTSPLDWAAGGGLSMATGNPLMLATMLARPAARAAILSGPVQNRLIQQPGTNALARLANGQAAQLGYRAAPVLLSDQ